MIIVTTMLMTGWTTIVIVHMIVRNKDDILLLVKMNLLGSFCNGQLANKWLKRDLLGSNNLNPIDGPTSCQGTADKKKSLINVFTVCSTCFGT